MIDTLAGALGLGAHDAAFWMPLVLAGLLFAIMVAGTVLDGFDIGVGCLLVVAPAALRPRMLSLLSPWRDANEFWPFLGLGLLMSAFPYAWGPIMGALALPLTLLGLGLLLRSASFELRLRAPLEWQPSCMAAFGIGSCITAVAHGLIVSRLVLSYTSDVIDGLLGGFFAVCALAAYALLGATWLIMREAGELRVHAVWWARRTVRWVAAGVVAVSLVLVLGNTGVFLKWGDRPDWALVAVVWGGLLLCFVALEMMLQRMINHSPRATALPFLLVLAIFLVALAGLGYSFFPYLILDDVTIWDAAASTSSLRFVVAAAAVTVPIAIAFNLRVYRSMFGLSKPPLPPEPPQLSV